MTWHDDPDPRGERDDAGAGPRDGDPWDGIPIEVRDGAPYDSDTTGGCG